MTKKQQHLDTLMELDARHDDLLQQLAELDAKINDVLIQCTQGRLFASGPLAQAGADAPSTQPG